MKKKKNAEWISDETLNEVTVRREIKSRSLNCPVDEVNYRKQNAKIQRLMRRDKEKFIEEQCKKIEENTVTNSTKDLYQGVKNLTRKFKPTMDTIKSEDGTILCDGDKVLKDGRSTAQGYIERMTN